MWWRERKVERPRAKADLTQFWFELVVVASAWALLFLIVYAVR